MDKYLFIEGTTDDTNGDLRQGFNKLLSQKLAGKMPRIKLGDGKTTTIGKFINGTSNVDNYLLIDLDAIESEKGNDIVRNNLTGKKDKVYFMIQEMESWFISQPNILDSYYGSKVSEKLPKKPAKEFSKPYEELQRITKDTKKKEYHKVKDGVELLAKLDANNLMKEFPDFDKLIKDLS